MSIISVNVNPKELMANNLRNAMADLSAGLVTMTTKYHELAGRGRGGNITTIRVGGFEQRFDEADVAKLEALFGETWPVAFWDIALPKMLGACVS